MDSYRLQLEEFLQQRVESGRKGNISWAVLTVYVDHVALSLNHCDSTLT